MYHIIRLVSAFVCDKYGMKLPPSYNDCVRHHSEDMRQVFALATVRINVKYVRLYLN